MTRATHFLGLAAPRVVLLLLAMVAVLSLAACSSDDEVTEPAEQTTTSTTSSDSTGVLRFNVFNDFGVFLDFDDQHHRRRSLRPRPWRTPPRPKR